MLMMIIPLFSISRSPAVDDVVVIVVDVDVITDLDVVVASVEDVTFVLDDFVVLVVFIDPVVVDKVEGDVGSRWDITIHSFMKTITYIYIHPNKHIDVSNEMKTNSMMFHLTLRNIPLLFLHIPTLHVQSSYYTDRILLDQSQTNFHHSMSHYHVYPMNMYTIHPRKLNYFLNIRCLTREQTLTCSYILTSSTFGKWSTWIVAIN